MQLIKNIPLIKLRICQNIYYFRVLCYKMIVFPFMVQEELITSSFRKILGCSILIQLIAKFFMDDILADTAILTNASKKEPLCVCYKHTSWMGWLLKKSALSVRRICQHFKKLCAKKGPPLQLTFPACQGNWIVGNTNFAEAFLTEKRL